MQRYLTIPQLAVLKFVGEINKLVITPPHIRCKLCGGDDDYHHTAHTHYDVAFYTALALQII